MRDLNQRPLNDHEIVRKCISCKEEFVADCRVEYLYLGYCSPKCQRMDGASKNYVEAFGPQIEVGDTVEYENDYGETISAPVIAVSEGRVKLDLGICTMEAPKVGMRVVGKVAKQ